MTDEELNIEANRIITEAEKGGTDPLAGLIKSKGPEIEQRAKELEHLKATREGIEKKINSMDDKSLQHYLSPQQVAIRETEAEINEALAPVRAAAKLAELEKEATKDYHGNWQAKLAADAAALDIDPDSLRLESLSPSPGAGYNRFALK